MCALFSPETLRTGAVKGLRHRKPEDCEFVGNREGDGRGLLGVTTTPSTITNTQLDYLRTQYQKGRVETAGQG